MWQLVINGPGYFDTAYDLPEGTTTLGRADENDIVLSGDLVSRRHARIVVSGDELKVEDLGSRNGSRLNGQPLQGLTALQAGDLVSVGENSLAVRQPVTAEAATTEMINVGVPDAGGVKRFGQGTDIGSSLILAKDVRESVVLRLLDNVAAFEPAAGPFDTQADGSAKLSYESLLLLYQVAEKLSTAPSLQAFLEGTVDRLMERVGATTAVVLLRHSSGVMTSAAVRHRGQLQQGEVPVSDAVVEAALAKGAAIAVADVRDDERFAQRESVILYGVDQVLCVPLGPREPFIGVLYLNRSGSARADVERLLDLCTAVAHLIGSGVEKFTLRERGPTDGRIRRALERFHAPSVVERRLAELKGSRYTHLADHPVTLMRIDMPGLGELSRKLGAERMLEVLNDYLQRASGLVFSFDGTLSRASPDDMTAVFGAPYQKGDDALRAVRAALAIRSEWRKACEKRLGSESCELRVGLHTGKVIAGVVGPDVCFDFTVLGEPVEVAGLLRNSADPGQVLITGKTLATVGARFDVTPLGERRLSPRVRVAVFDVLEEDVGQSTNPELETV